MQHWWQNLSSEIIFSYPYFKFFEQMMHSVKITTQVHELIFFRCEVCPSKFVRKYALRRHMENVHKLVGVKVEGQNVV